MYFFRSELLRRHTQYIFLVFLGQSTFHCSHSLHQNIGLESKILVLALIWKHANCRVRPLHDAIYCSATHEKKFDTGSHSLDNLTQRVRTAKMVILGSSVLAFEKTWKVFVQWVYKTPLVPSWVFYGDWSGKIIIVVSLFRPYCLKFGRSFKGSYKRININHRTLDKIIAQESSLLSIYRPGSTLFQPSINPQRFLSNHVAESSWRISSFFPAQIKTKTNHTYLCDPKPGANCGICAWLGFMVSMRHWSLCLVHPERTQRVSRCEAHKTICAADQ